MLLVILWRSGTIIIQFSMSEVWKSPGYFVIRTCTSLKWYPRYHPNLPFRYNLSAYLRSGLVIYYLDDSLQSSHTVWAQMTFAFRDWASGCCYVCRDWVYWWVSSFCSLPSCSFCLGKVGGVFLVLMIHEDEISARLSQTCSSYDTKSGVFNFDSG